MKSSYKILTGLALVLSVSLNANATFGPATMSISDSTVSTDVATRSSLLLAVSDDVKDDVDSNGTTNDDSRNDDSTHGNDDNSNDDNGNDDNSNDDNAVETEKPEKPEVED